MKKTISALLLALSLVISFSMFSVYAENTVITSNFDSGVSAYGGTSMLGQASATAVTGKSAFFCAKIAGGLGGDTVGIHEVACGSDGNHLSNGTRRTKLIPLSSTAAAGTYKMSVWVADPHGTMSAQGADFGALITFHSSSVTDSSLVLDWNSKTNSNAVVKVFDIKGTDETNNELVGTHYGKYDGSKAKLTAGAKKEVNGTEWVEYTGNVTLTKDSSQIALWLYMWAGYENVAASDGHNVYFDDLTLTAVSGSSDNNPGTFDIIAVAAIIGIAGASGIRVASKKKRG